MKALDGCKWSTSAPAALAPGNHPATHLVVGWMGPRTGLDVLEKTS